MALPLDQVRLNRMFLNPLELIKRSHPLDIIKNALRSPINPDGSTRDYPEDDPGSSNPEIQMTDSGDPSSNDHMEAERQLRELLGQIPKREDYPQPGKGRRFMAGLISLSNINNPQQGQAGSDRMRNPDYYKAMEAWKEKLDPLKVLSTNESAIRNTERLAESSERTARINQQRADTAETAAQAKIENDKKARENEAQRIRVQQYTAENPNHVLIKDKDGFVSGYNPRTDKATRIVDDLGFRVTYNSLTPDQQIGIVNKRIAGSIAVAKETGSQTRQTQAARYTLMEKLERLKQSGQIELKKTPSGGVVASAGKNAAGKPLQPSQQRIDRINRMMEIVSDNPELDGYYDLDDKGNVHVKKDVDDEDLREVAVKLLFPEGEDVELVKDSAESTTSPTETHKIGDKKVYPNGNIGEWDGKGFRLVGKQ